MKKLNLLFTALLLLCSVGTATAHSFEVDGIYYYITSSTNKTVEVTYKGPYSISYSNEYTGSVVIPESVTCNGSTYSVTSIGREAFFDCDGLTSITIPNSVTSIGSSAFENCTGLTSITIPNSVTSIGIWAFEYCTGLTSITIPNSVTSIGEWAFASCTGLTSITIPNSVTSIGESAFRDCTGLKTVYNFSNLTFSKGSSGYGYVAYYADKVYNLPEGFFENDLVLGKVDGVNTLIAYLGNATELTLPADYKGENYVIAAYAFKGNTTITSIVIPNSVTSIGEGAFYECTGLTSITIPNSVTSIGEDAFYECDGLKTVYNFSNLTFTKGSSGYGYIAYYADKVYNAPNGSIEGDFIFGKPNDVNTLLYYLGNATELTLPTDYKGENYAIGANVFNGNTTITSVTIPNSVTSIGNNAFYGCTGLTSIAIPNSVTSIGSYAFYDTAWYNNQPDGIVYAGKVLYKYKGTMPSNTSITIKDGTLGIADRAFSGCIGLTSIIIPNSVTSIGEEAFNGCSNLETIYISSAIESIGNRAFAGCDKIKEIKLGAKKPIRVSADIFTNAVYDNATLYIPNGTEQLYQKREPWNIFFYIVEMDYTGIENVKTESGKVKTIYDLNGRVVENPSSGIYIINGKKCWLSESGD